MDFEYEEVGERVALLERGTPLYSLERDSDRLALAAWLRHCRGWRSLTAGG